MAQQDLDYIRVRLGMFVTCILALILILIFMGCGIKQTRPDGTYPKTRTPWVGIRLPNIGMNQLRCFGGGIGGCSMSGKAYDGPAGGGR